MPTNEKSAAGKTKPVIAIVGPTASGKTALSLRLSEKLPVEIVACDSRTIYRRMDIGTAKPSKEEQAKVSHHLLDVADVSETYTVARYKEDAERAIAEIHRRDKIPIVCGGTGFYARALLEGLSIPEVPPNLQLRKELNDFADKNGNEKLLERLKESDSVTALRLNANDRFRVVRALEVTLALGKPFSEAATLKPAPYPTIWIGMGVSNRQYIKDLIETRLDEQIAAGLLEEVSSLLADFGPTRALLNAVPYKEVIAYLDGNCTLDQARQDALKHNYQLARRQIMWFRANENTHWFNVDVEDREQIFSQVCELIDRKLSS
ncbi:MAG: tRNA (adenosine(37)-N6)-dimethylallyltransferase MiaA [Candidatus Melainabacteria bacterium]|jgi:tRNA dimethylallyltransferase|nr:tRNA (adenosine(37)-N6)-dimethylallyltransferase MiaA [Candidatus Melainabacteria bacterium]